MSNAYDPRTEELEHIAGDPPRGMYEAGQHLDPMGTGKMGHASQMDMTKGAEAHPMIRYKQFVIEADVYRVPDTEEISVVILCPMCKNALTISSKKKQLRFDPPSEKYPQGLLSCEAFECTWERDNEGRRMEFGLGLCRWRVGISNNVAKDA